MPNYRPQRENGACFGSLWKQHVKPSSSPSLVYISKVDKAASREALAVNERAKSHDFCVLAGNILAGYESFSAFRRGDHPTSEIKIVGASAWNPPAYRKRSNPSKSNFKANVSSHASTIDPKANNCNDLQVEVADHLLSGEVSGKGGNNNMVGNREGGNGNRREGKIKGGSEKDEIITSSSLTNNSSSSGPPTFQIVTYAGTMVYCSTQTHACRDVWLEALHAGLEIYLTTGNGHESGSDCDRSSGGNGNEGNRNRSIPAPRDAKIFAPPPVESRFRKRRSRRGDNNCEPSDSSNADSISNNSSSNGSIISARSASNISPSPTSPLSSSSVHRQGGPFSDPYESSANGNPLCKQHCISCGRFPPESAMHPYTSATPLPHYGFESRTKVCRPCLVGQGLLRHVEFLVALHGAEEHGKVALVDARIMADKVVNFALEEEKEIQRMSKKMAEQQRQREQKEVSGGKGNGDDQQQCWENLNRDNNRNFTHKGDNDINTDEERPVSPAHSDGEWTRVDVPSSTNIPQVINPCANDVTPSHSTTTNDKNNARNNNNNGWVDLPPASHANAALLTLVGSPAFSTHRRRSQVLNLDCRALESGKVETATAFLEILHERTWDGNHRQNGGGGHLDRRHFWNGQRNQAVEMKNEVLKVAGDMGAAIRLLQEYALDRNCLYASSTSVSSGGDGREGWRSVEMLACVLEFFLDLCDNGDIGAVAFFWPQFAQIHLQMLPPMDAVSMLRVELMEDFLLTVCVKHSVHLALELIWSCIADIEESMGGKNLEHSSMSSSATAAAAGGAACRRRRFALVRFVCELESLLFDFDGGWGGGSVGLRGMVSLSVHQAVLINDAMIALQKYRVHGSHCLSRSVRIEKLKRDTAVRRERNARVSSNQSIAESKSHDISSSLPSHNNSTQSDQDIAIHKYKIARNAEYYSTQLMFTRRLGDIAESLHFIDPKLRPYELEQELNTLNSSGQMGGDPLNQICLDENDLTSVLHIPSTEGHVFRSKDRTPVLMLMEVMKNESLLFPTGDMNNQNNCKDMEKSERNTVNKIEGGEEGNDSRNSKIMIPELLSHQETPCPSLTIDTCSSPARGMRKKIVTSPSHSKDEIEDLVVGMIQEKMNLDNNVADKLEAEGESYNEIKSCEISEFDASVIENQSGDGEKEIDNNTINICRNSKQIQTPILDGNNECEGQFIVSQDSLCQVETQPKTKVTAQEDKMSDKIDHHSQPKQQHKIDHHSQPKQQQRLTPFGLVKSETEGRENSDLIPLSSSLALHGEGRREVLTTIFLKGMKSSNCIARGIAPAAQRAVQAMDHYRAVKLIASNAYDIGNKSREIDSGNLGSVSVQEVLDYNTKILNSKDKRALFDTSMALSQDLLKEEEFNITPPTEEDECIESLRLVLIQNRVGKGNLTLEKAALALASRDLDKISSEISEVDLTRTGVSAGENKMKDASELDDRLVGCGSVSQAIFSAVELWKESVISNSELLELVKKDLKFNLLSLPSTENEDKLKEDSAFWGRFAFGERWVEKKARIQASSENGSKQGWDLVGVIVKANDDLRQEAFVMQLIKLCEEAFQMSGLELWVQPYRILATGRTTGIIEMVRNAMSFDSLKKRPGYKSGELLGHFKRMAECAADPDEALRIAQKNFVRSLAAYSLLSYLFMFKDRHNGNILLDTAGHVIHIDFGFVFGTAPGGSFSLEHNTPFKLTKDMIDLMGGRRSPLFSEFVTLFCCGFLALQANAELFLTLVEITSEGSTFNCFEGKDTDEIVTKLRERFCLTFTKEKTIAYAMELIKRASNSYGTTQYDFFQYLQNGIAT